MVTLGKPADLLVIIKESTEVTENGNRMFGLRGSFGAGDLDRI